MDVFNLINTPKRRQIMRYVKRKTYTLHALAASKVLAAAGLSFVLLGLLAVLAGADFGMGSFAINLGGTGMVMLSLSIPAFLVIKVVEKCDSVRGLSG